MENKKNESSVTISKKKKSKEKEKEKEKTQIPRPGIVVHPDAPQRLNVDNEPIVGACCG